MVVLFSDDFSSGDLSQWDEIGGTPTVVTSPLPPAPYTTTFAAKFTTNPATAVYNCFVHKGSIFRTGVYGSALVYLGNLPISGDDSVTLLSFETDVGFWLLAGAFNRNGSVYWATQDPNGVWILAGSGPTVGRWYLVEVQGVQNSKCDIVITDVLTNNVVRLSFPETSVRQFKGPYLGSMTTGPESITVYATKFTFTDVSAPSGNGTLTLSAVSGGNPVSATFTAGGQSQAGTTVSFSLSPSSYIATAVYNGVTLTSPSLTVTANGTTTYTFDFTTSQNGTLLVNATQDGTTVNASVTVNGQSGTTPASFSLTPKTYTVTASYQGTTLPSQTIVVTAGQTSTITFHFIASYSLTVNSTPITGIPIAIDGTSYNTNTSVTLASGAHSVNVPPSFVSGGATYVFSQWDDGTISLTRTVNLTSNATITATYVRVKWNLVVSSTPITGIPITVDGTPYTTNTPSISLDEGQHTVIAPATFTSGSSLYAFLQWEDGSVATTRVVQLNTNKSLIVTYALVYRNLTVNTSPITGVQFTVDGTAYTSNATVSLVQGSHSVTVPAQVTNGTDLYGFVSWENGSTSLTRSVSVTADASITATYALVKYNLTVSAPAGVQVTIDGTGYIAPITVSLSYGQHVVTAPATYVSGPTTYAFSKWDDNSTALSRAINLTANTTIIATYVAVKPSLTLLSSPTGAGTLTATPTGPYDVGQTVVINALAIDPVNNSFSRWIDENGATLSNQAMTSLTMGTANRTLTAVFTSITHPTLTLQIAPAGVGGSISVSPSPPYNVGQTVIVSATPPAGWAVSGWTKDGTDMGTTASSVQVTLDVSHVITVTFAQIKWNLTVATSPTGVTLTIDGASYASNVTVSLSQGSHVVAVPQSVVSGGKTYNFQKWEDNSTNASRSVQLTADRTITAFFVEVTHTLTINTAPSGISPITVDGNAYTAPVQVTDGTHAITVPQTVVLGGVTYVFQKWEDGSTNTTRNITTSANTTVTATYVVQIIYHDLVVISSPLSNIPITVDGVSYVTNTPTIVLADGSHTVVVPQLVISGPSTYNFNNWEDGSTAAMRTFSLTADRTITANYTKIVPTLTLNVSPAGVGTVSATPPPPYDKDEVVVIAATVNDPVNYRWVKWIKEDGSDYSAQQTTSVTMNADRALTAVFESIVHPTLTLVANPAANGTLSVAEAPPYTVGQVVHVTGKANEGGILVGWLQDGVPFNGTSATVDVTLDKSHVITANFKPIFQAGFPWWMLVVAIPAAAAVSYTFAKPSQTRAKRRR